MHIIMLCHICIEIYVFTGAHYKLFSNIFLDHLHIQCDIENEDDVKRAFSTISKEFNRVDVLVNAAGK